MERWHLVRIVGPRQAPQAIIVDEGQQIDAYEDARACLEGDLLPFVSLRWDVHA
jgi:hypothetical protein